MEKDRKIDENMTIKEVAEKLNHSETWVRLGLQQKTLPFRKCSSQSRKRHLELPYIKSRILEISVWICTQRTAKKYIGVKNNDITRMVS